MSNLWNQTPPVARDDCIIYAVSTDASPQDELCGLSDGRVVLCHFPLEVASDSPQRHQWMVLAVLEAEDGFRRLDGYENLPRLQAALKEAIPNNE